MLSGDLAWLGNIMPPRAERQRPDARARVSSPTVADEPLDDGCSMTCCTPTQEPLGPYRYRVVRSDYLGSGFRALYTGSLPHLAGLEWVAEVPIPFHCVKLLGILCVVFGVVIFVYGSVSFYFDSSTTWVAIWALLLVVGGMMWWVGDLMAVDKALRRLRVEAVELISRKAAGNIKVVVEGPPLASLSAPALPDGAGDSGRAADWPSGWRSEPALPDGAGDSDRGAGWPGSWRPRPASAPRAAPKSRAQSVAYGDPGSAPIEDVEEDEEKALRLALAASLGSEALAASLRSERQPLVPNPPGPPRRPVGYGTGSAPTDI